MREIPVYMVNGLLESGKTLFIQDIVKTDFADGVKTLLIMCEDGEEEYDKEELAKAGVTLVHYEPDADVTDDMQKTLTGQFMAKCMKEYSPKRVIIEYNGMWMPENFYEEDMPRGWVMVQSIVLVNNETFGMYWNNLRSIMVEHFKYSDTVVFNRCDDATDRAALRRSVKSVNRQAQIAFEGADDDEDELPPYDISGDLITIEDDDFGIWYLDMLDYPDRYCGKKVCVKGLAFRAPDMQENEFVPGRFAMACCADDMQFIGFVSKLPVGMQLKLKGPEEKRWITVTAKVKYEYCKHYQGEGPVLYVEQYLDSDKPQDEIAYFT